MDKICFKINGVQHTIGCEVSSDLTLLDYVREAVELRGTKYMCREAGCGACMVSARKPNGVPYAVNSCMMSVASCHGLEITTVEEVGNRKKGYHPLQTTLAKHNGTQCGYCTPGWIMSMYSLLQSKPDLTMMEIEQSFGSNICRCTGYRPIMDSFKKFAKDSPEKQILDIENLHLCKKSCKCCDKSQCADDDWCKVDEENILDYSDIKIKLKDGKFWYRVTNIKGIFDILREKGDDSYMLVAGNTAKGVHPIDEYPRILIDINGVTELEGHKMDQNLVIGASTTLTELIEIFEKMAEQEYFTYLLKLCDHLKKVAHIPVRNLGTIAGNLMIKHKWNIFPSDVYLLLETVGAQLTLIRCNLKVKTVTMQEFLNTNMKGVVILNVMLPPLSNAHKIETFKVMPRSTGVHSIVNAGFLYKLTSNNAVICSRIVFGGLSPSFNRACKTEKYLVGKELFKNETLQLALGILENELVVVESSPNPSVEFRRTLATRLFYKGLLSLCPENILDIRYKSGTIKLHDTRPVSKASQYYETDPSTYPINQPIQKVEALIQCAGEAFYSDDLPAQPYEVFAALTLTTVAIGDIVSINPKKALSQPGVIAFYTAEDIPGINSFTPTDGIQYLIEEEIFCKGKVKYFSQVYGVIVAETHVIAEKAAKMVEVEYKNVTKPVTDIKEAIKDLTRVKLSASIEPTDMGKDVTKVIKTGYTMYGQFHFPMENFVCVAHPTQEGMQVYTSTHWTDGVQMMMSRALKIDQNCIDVYVRNVGGSFGFKIDRSIQSAIACGLVVTKLNRPCRLLQPLTTTTRSVGKKLPCTSKIEVGVNNDGVIQHMNYDFFQDDGYVMSMSFSDLITTTYENCYDKSKWKLNYYSTTTDTAKNSWLRAPGYTDTVGICEQLMDQIAYELSIDPITVRLNNLNREEIVLEEMLNTLKFKSKYDERRLAVNNYNNEHRWKKRGLRCSFLKHRTGALGTLNVIVSVYRGDGTVIITHGGVDMGQGLNTKAIQICAYYLKIPIEKIQVKATNTIVAPNSVETAASIGSQNVGLGVRRACKTLLKRLEPIRNQMSGATWEEIVAKAYVSNVDLQAQSFVSFAEIEKYSHTIYGVSLAEVEIDVLTGELEILRVDIIEDVGKSVSPEIDVGQVEGAFIMGLGYWTSEKIVYDNNTGELLTNRTWNYSVPMNTDIPQDFRVYFRNNSYSFEAIHGAKAVSEPPKCLSVSVALAIREAISQARRESGIPTTDWFNIDGPLTVEMIGLSTAIKKATELKFN